jgi:hypothetical protein
MTTCLCPNCSSDPLPSYMPDFRMECEARYLLAMPLEQRREELGSKWRVARRQALEDELNRQWMAARMGRA